MNMKPEDIKELEEMMLNKRSQNFTSSEAKRFIQRYTQYSDSELADIIVDQRLGIPLSLIGFSDGHAFLVGGLNFGYVGTGPDTFKEILMDNGVDEEKADIVRKKRNNTTTGRLTWERKTGTINIEG